MEWIAIVGSRKYPNKPRIKRVMKKIAAKGQEWCVIVTGDAAGTDSYVKLMCQELGLPCLVVPALWEKYGKRAGPIRNKRIVDLADYVFAFWDSISPGTKSTIQIATSSKKPVTIYR